MMTEDKPRERRDTEPLPPIRKGYTKITSWDEVDFDLPIVQERLYAAYAVLARRLHSQEQAQTDLTARPLPWQHLADQNSYQCDMPPHRVIVSRTDDGLFWQGSLEGADQDMEQGLTFVKLEEALTWGEKTLIGATEVPTPPQRAGKTKQTKRGKR